MILALYIALALVDAGVCLYFALRSREFRKFLAGAFFASWGILVYLYCANVSVPILGTHIIATPRSSGLRSIVHFALFVLCFHFGFVSRPQDQASHPSDAKR